ncbi:MAG: hypothetical protein ABIE74_03865 [Pseudomonadota bacterium]
MLIANDSMPEPVPNQPINNIIQHPDGSCTTDTPLLFMDRKTGNILTSTQSSYGWKLGILMPDPALSVPKQNVVDHCVYLRGIFLLEKEGSVIDLPFPVPEHLFEFRRVDKGALGLPQEVLEGIEFHKMINSLIELPSSAFVNAYLLEDGTIKLAVQGIESVDGQLIGSFELVVDLYQNPITRHFVFGLFVNPGKELEENIGILIAEDAANDLESSISSRDTVVSPPNINFISAENPTASFIEAARRILRGLSGVFGSQFKGTRSDISDDKGYERLSASEMLHIKFNKGSDHLLIQNLNQTHSRFFGPMR